ncbi:ribonuclease E inhibitor RraB [Paraferrimonas sedimenticola]|uniref:Regulator of ribonuclease activity B domain-containing protein n=1 Tax=Paraferrimonas sedimenticola TaxID=375674 RepID=A0AA37RWI2_9GAMM|nr:ribonuclease E inhibitor RraB [Paraferrimonas sedimenticola]GLP96651.1 hypothetical protein GCM10007895_19570 [Paraferrimonas sedimenticola]
MSFPNDDNGKMLQAMVDAGMSLDQPMEIDFFMVFEDQGDAESAMAQFEDDNPGAFVELQLDEEQGVWELVVAKSMVPEYQTIIDTEVGLDEFAQGFNGFSDGWGVMQHQEGDPEVE